MARKRKNPDDEIVNLELNDWRRSVAYALLQRSIQVEPLNKNRALKFTYFDAGTVKTITIPGPVELVVRIAYFFKEHINRTDETLVIQPYGRPAVSHPKITKSRRTARIINRKTGASKRRRPV